MKGLEHNRLKLVGAKCFMGFEPGFELLQQIVEI